MNLGEKKYLKAIFIISQRDGIPVSTSAIANELGTTSASVTDMVQKLGNKNLLAYKKYKGVSLTDRGASIAIQMIRNNRIWKTFLINHLGYQWDEVSEIANDFESIQNEDFINRLDDFIGQPKYDPLGEPIPDMFGKFTLRTQQPLHSIEPGRSCVVLGVQRNDSSFLQFLNSLNIRIGSILQVVDKIQFDESILIEFNHQKAILPSKIARYILVKT